MQDAVSSSGEQIQRADHPCSQLTRPETTGLVPSIDARLKSNERSALADLCGIANTELAGSIVNQALATFSRYDPDKKNASLAIAAFREIAPKDTFEGMLAAQMLGTHNLAMACLGRAANADLADTIARNIDLATKLTRTFTAQVEALNSHRGKGQQKVTVEHVTVNAGGQAIVGSVQAAASRGHKVSRVAGEGG